MAKLFEKDFYPTPPEVIEQILATEKIEGKVILEPSAGSGNFVDYLYAAGAKEVLACETNKYLAEILKTKCNYIRDDFFTIESHQVSHIDLIVMNPPFSADEKHILHAWNVAPDGCRMVALCNSETLENRWSRLRGELGTLVETYGRYQKLGQCFKTSERPTDVEVSVIYLQKPGGTYSQEFDGFFMDDDPAEDQENALMPYNVVRDLVNRYIAAIKIFDEQLEVAIRLNNLIGSFFNSNVGFQVTEKGAPLSRANFMKSLQKDAWNHVFKKLDLNKISTQGLKNDINKFVEQQHNIPFTMRNVYRMIEIVIGTTSERMDRALMEVFDNITMHYHDNRYNLEGWKTNSHYILNRKFIMPNVISANWNGYMGTGIYSRGETITDLVKAICFLTGDNFDKYGYFDSFLHKENLRFGETHEYAFFTFKGYRKGTIHLTFKDEDVWAKFNQRIAKIKGFPLPEKL